mgnify:CR=1 FL=1
MLPASSSLPAAASPSFNLTALSPRLQGVVGGANKPGAPPAVASMSAFALDGGSADCGALPEPTPTATPALPSASTPAPGADNAAANANANKDIKDADVDSDPLSAWVRANGGTRALRRILICNNGIAAVKAIRSMRQWCYQVFGDDKVLQFVAMATPEDLRANAEYIHLADEFVPVPGGSNNNNYANIHLITEIAETTKCDAVWAGWGHASENPRLPDLLSNTASKVVWIGPPSHAMRALGDKIGSTLIAQSAGVPCMPWTGDGLTVDYASTGIPDDIYARSCVDTVDAAMQHALRIGFPVMIKASEGGGGKGIRRVECADDVAMAFRQVQGEVPGSPVFIMKLAGKCRHLEVQLLCDSWGDAIAVFGRDCSIQRRHQKIIEEGPVVAAPPDVWHRMEQSAVRLAKEVGYVGAGTVEYLYMDDGSYSFLELNPRLQVEHPVTELISGVNLPAAQLQVAMGIPLQRMPGVRRMYGETADSESRIDFDTRRAQTLPGHVIACRITAENPDDKFQPTSGVIQELHFRSTPDVWGYFSVGPKGLVHEFADSQFGHLFAVGATRELARQSMVQALKELEIRGEIRTTIEYLRVVLEADDYKNNLISTTWLEKVMANQAIASERPDTPLAVLCGALFRAHAQVQQREIEYQAILARGQLPTGKLYNALVSADVELIYDAVKYMLTVTKSGPTSYDLTITGVPAKPSAAAASAAEPAAGEVPAPSPVSTGPGAAAAAGAQAGAAGSKSGAAAPAVFSASADIHNLSDGGFLVLLNGRKHVVYGREFASGLRLTIDARTCLFSQEYDPTQMRSQIQGKLVQWLVADRAHVAKGQPVAELEVMKMYVTIAAPEAGVITTIKPPGSVTEVGDLLAALALDDPDCVQKAEPFSGVFPSCAAIEPVVAAETVLAGKPHVRLRNAENKLRMLLSGYVLSPRVQAQSLADLTTCLTDPMLPALQFNELASNMAGRLPQPLLEQFTRLVSDYVAAVRASGTSKSAAACSTATVVPATASTASSCAGAGGDLVFPAAALERAMLAFTDAAASAAAAAAGLPCAQTTGASLTATKSALEASGLWGLVQQYLPGNLAYAGRVIKAMLLEYLAVEEVFLLTNGAGGRSATTAAVPVSSEDIIHALRKANKDNVGYVAALARAHHQLAPRTELVCHLLSLGTSAFPFLLRDADWLALLRRLTALRSKPTSGLVLQARQVLMRLRLPSLSVRMAAIERALNRAIAFERAAPQTSVGDRATVHARALASLVDQSQPIEDVILRFVTHSDKAVAALALEVAIRRAFKLFTVPALAVVAGADAVAQSQTLQERAAYPTQAPITHDILAKWVFHMDYKSATADSGVTNGDGKGSSPRLSPAATGVEVPTPSVAAANAAVAMALPSARGQPAVPIPAATPGGAASGMGRPPLPKSAASAAAAHAAAANGGAAAAGSAATGAPLTSSRFMRIDSLAALQRESSAFAASVNEAELGPARALVISPQQVKDGSVAADEPEHGGDDDDDDDDDDEDEDGDTFDTELLKSLRSSASPMSSASGAEGNGAGNHSAAFVASPTAGEEGAQLLRRMGVMAHFPTLDALRAGFSALAAEFENAPRNRACAKVLRRVPVHVLYIYVSSLPASLCSVSGASASAGSSAGSSAASTAAASTAASSNSSAAGASSANSSGAPEGAAERDAAAAAALQCIVDDHAATLARYRVRRVTFILSPNGATSAPCAEDATSASGAACVVGAASGAEAAACGAGGSGSGEHPLYFTYRQSGAVGEFAEDTATRHIEPNHALHMQLYRLDKYDYDLVPTTNRMVHLFAAVPKTVTAKLKAAAAAGTAAAPARAAYDGRRFFARVLVRRLDSAQMHRIIKDVADEDDEPIVVSSAAVADTPSVAAANAALASATAATTPIGRTRSVSSASAAAASAVNAANAATAARAVATAALADSIADDSNGAGAAPGTANAAAAAAAAAATGGAHPETEVAFVEALNSLEIAMAKTGALSSGSASAASAAVSSAAAGRAAATGAAAGVGSVLQTPGGNGKWMFNHIFVNVLVDVNVDLPSAQQQQQQHGDVAHGGFESVFTSPSSRINIGYVDSIIRSLTRRYSEKIHRLHITHVEFALTIRLRQSATGPSISLPCRFICENPTGFVLEVNAFYEHTDPATGRVVLRPLAAPAPPALPAPSAGAVAVAGAPAAAPAQTTFMDADAPYETSFPHQNQRLTAASMDTVWCYDFPPLFDKTIRRVWRAHLLSLLAAAASEAAAEVGAASAAGAAAAAMTALPTVRLLRMLVAALLPNNDSPTTAPVTPAAVPAGVSAGGAAAALASELAGAMALLRTAPLEHFRAAGRALLGLSVSAAAASPSGAVPAASVGDTAAGLRAAACALPARSLAVIAEFSHVSARIPSVFVSATELVLAPNPTPAAAGAGDYSDAYVLTEVSRAPGLNNIGMVAWRVTLNTPECLGATFPLSLDTPAVAPEPAAGRDVVIIANDITHMAGSFGPAEDALFDLASKHARARGLPRLYLAANSGARIGLAEELRGKYKVAWMPPTTTVDADSPSRGFEYLYLTPADYAALSGSVKCTKVTVEGEERYVITDVIGAKDGLGVENLRGSGQIAGETSLAYDDIFTLTYVTCRSVGIGAYLARLGQRVIQKSDPAQPLLLTGYQALNKLLGRAVYTSNVQLGGPDIMYTNGVTHLCVPNDLEGCLAIIRWLSYVPLTRRGTAPILGRTADDVNRLVTFAPASKTSLYDPRCLITGTHGSLTSTLAAAAAASAASAKAGASALPNATPTHHELATGLFDRDSFLEVMGGWARGVVAGRARLGGVPVGVVAVDPRTVEYTVPADPAGGDDSREVVLSKAGQVWFPDSAFKTAQAIKDMAAEDIPLVVLANWRGFSGGMQDMLNEILKFGSYIVDALRGMEQPVLVYLPPHAMLRGGAWVVVDETINADHMEMFADPTARGGVLEPEGTVDVKFRKDQIVAEMHKTDPKLVKLAADIKAAPTPAVAAALRSQARTREGQLYPVYLQIATTFADLHDTPVRMHTKGCIRAVVPWAHARTRFYWRLTARLAEAALAKRIVAAHAAADAVTAALAGPSAAVPAAATAAAAPAEGGVVVADTVAPSPLRRARAVLRQWLTEIAPSPAAAAAVAASAAGAAAGHADDATVAALLADPAVVAQVEAKLAALKSSAALAALKTLIGAGVLQGPDVAAAAQVIAAALKQ